MDFFERLVMKLTKFSQIYCISCLVQLLRNRFHKVLNVTFHFSIFIIIFVLYTPFKPLHSLPLPPRFHPCLHPPPPPPPPPFTTPSHLPASLPQPPFAPPPLYGGYLLVDFGGGGVSLPPPPKV